MNLAIVVDEKWGIGRDGGLLAHLPEGMRYFREATNGRTMVMGRRTLESFSDGKSLKNRVSMVLSGNESYSLEDVQVYHRAEDVLETLEDYSEDDVFIVGRGMIYREFLPYYNKAYITYVHRTFEVDTDFEDLDQDEDWRLKSISDDRKHEGTSLEFRTYRRVR